MHVKAWTLSKPIPNERSLVGAVIVHDEMDIESTRHLRLDCIQKLSELHRAMTTVKLAHDLTCLGLERRKQRGRTVPLVIMSAPLGLARPHRQQWLGSIERLNLGLLIDTKHDGVFWRINVQPDNVTHLLDQQWVGRQLERFGPMRLQTEGSPDAVYGHVIQPRGFRHPPHAPVSRPTWFRFQSANDYLLDLLVGYPTRRTRPRLIIQPVKPVPHKARPPLTHRRGRQAQPTCNGLVISSFSARQHDAGPSGQHRCSARAIRQRFQSLSLVIGQHQFNLGASRAHAHSSFFIEQYVGTSYLFH